MRLSLPLLSLVASAMAATVPSSAWTSLIPTGTAPSCAIASYSNTFGIAISTITTEVNVNAKRDLATQIGDGQIQATTSTKDETSTKKTSTSTEANVETTTIKNADHTITKKQTLYVSHYGSSAIAIDNSQSQVLVTQIGDGQVQIPNPTPIVEESLIVKSSDSSATTSTTYVPVTSSSSFSYRKFSSKVTSSETSESSSSSSTSESSSPESKSSSTSTSSSKSSSAASSSASSCPTGSVASEATCKSDGDLAMTLVDGILTDSSGRIGSIVANRQFQFDGPPPQAGAIYASGWSINDGHLMIGDDYIFWQCLSGTFYNLYDQSIGDQCTPVVLNIVDLVDC